MKGFRRVMVANFAEKLVHCELAVFICLLYSFLNFPL
jgi:hypothetical protein